MAKLSELMAQRRQQEQKTDQSLTRAYVDALQKGRNYQEVQGAYGQGSGTAAQAALARDMELQKRLTDLRGVQAASAAQSGMTGAGYGADMRAAIAKSLESTNSERNKALLDAAEKEEQTMVDLQKFTGDAAAKNGDYTILGKLYGLTDAQIAALMPQTAASGSGEEPKKRGTKNPVSGYYSGWKNTAVMNRLNKAIAAAKKPTVSTAVNKKGRYGTY